MSKAAQSPFSLPEGFSGLTAATKESFDSMTHAYSEWLQNANRVQAEVIRFIGDRFNKDASLISRFAACRKPDEFLRLQADAMTELAGDYMQEGARIFSLFSDVSREAFGEFAKTAGKSSKRSG